MDGSEQVAISIECAEPISRNDIILFRSAAARMPLIKTVKAVPGDSIEIRKDTLLINHSIARNNENAPYALSKHGIAMLGLYIRDHKGVVPRGTYLVLGEKPSGTLDSTRFGLVPRANIMGKVIEPYPKSDQ